MKRIIYVVVDLDFPHALRAFWKKEDADRYSDRIRNAYGIDNVVSDVWLMEGEDVKEKVQG